ncbi:MAG: hypothetical protein LBB77_10095, partial [Treponema sp.]|nr:hypothetical protein [Treponema sp.]
MANIGFSTVGVTSLDGVPFGSRQWRALLAKLIWKYKFVYLFMVGPTLALIIVFRYLPMPGIFLSFESF